MQPLEVRIVTPAERRERLGRLSGIVEPTPDIIQIPVASIPNEQMEQAHEIFFKGGFTRIETIQRAVVANFPGVTVNDLKSARRTASIVIPRQIAMYLCRSLTTRSLPDIGRRFGGRDHTTVIFSVRKIGEKRKTDAKLDDLLNTIVSQIGGWNV